MKGRIYISGAFTTVNRSKCGGGKGWLDNDPHFWTNPPTWGICRSDLRRLVKEEDYVFFVLPTKSELPQMVYGYLQVKDKIRHIDAYRRPGLKSKRMRPPSPGRPNGNIIVTANGRYNRLDGNKDHEERFQTIKEHYVIGDERNSKFLLEDKIRRLAPRFIEKLNDVFEDDGERPIDVISRWGRVLNGGQVEKLLNWLGS